MRDESRWFVVGDVAVVRYITRTGSLPGTAWACRVLDDGPDGVQLYFPAGAEYIRWLLPGPEGERPEPTYATWPGDMLRMMFPGRQYSIWLFWDREGGGRKFTGYYVNMEEPFRRTEIGFDTNDHALDIVVAPDLNWRWKDVEEFEELVANGAYREEFAASVRSAAEEAVELIEGRKSPFGDGWETWEPPAEWDPPSLPEHWKDVPAKVWERRDWAFGRQG
jgi:hypothetical protein